MKKGYFKFVFAFGCVFLGLVSCIVIPVTLIDGKYVELTVSVTALIFIMAILLWLRQVLIAPAVDFILSDDTILFLHDGRTEMLRCGDVSEIIITQYRYIFRDKGGKKHTVSRLTGISKLQKDVDRRIFEIVHRFDIPYRQHFLSI